MAKFLFQKNNKYGCHQAWNKGIPCSDIMKKKISDSNSVKRIENEYVINIKNGCWEWIKAKNKYGYGILKVKQKQYIASRYFYEKFKGKIPIELTIDHLCRNKICVNPEHLEAVSQVENCRRRLSTKLDYKKVKEICELYKNGVKQIDISKLFNIGQDHVSRIVNGLRWNIAT